MTTTAQSQVAARPLLTGGFVAWLVAATVSATGDGVLFFAIAWTATGLGGQLAGVVITIGLLPQVALTLFGGAAADRLGLRRTIIGCNLASCGLLAGYLAVERTDLPTVVVLCALEFGVGLVDAFHVPANGAFPRLFFSDDTLARGLSLTGSVLSVARLAGPPLGGVVVVALALDGAALADLVSFGMVLAVLVLVRPPYEPAPEAPDGTSMLHRVRAGLVACRAVPGAFALLGSVACVAASLIPLLTLCVPLLVRARAWGASTAGLVEAAWIVGTLVVSLLVARTGTRARPAGPLVVGPLVAAAGVAAVATAPVPAAALAGGFVMGVGTAVYTSHVFPLYMLKTPAGMLARFQALIVVVQQLPMLAANSALGGLAEGLGPVAAMLAGGGVCASAGLLVALSPALRSARLE